MRSLFDHDNFNQRLFFPSDDASRCPENATDLWVFPGGVTLHVRWHHAVTDGPTVLLFHGNGETVSAYDRTAATDYARIGVNLAVVDYRGYGLSTGEPTLRNTLEDAPAVLKTVRDAVKGKLFVMGRSLGSLCSAALYGAKTPPVAGFIQESGMVDLKALLRRRGFLAPPKFTAAERSAFDPETKLQKGTLPLLVLHATHDEIIPVEEAHTAYAVAGATDKTLALIEGLGHNNLSFAPEYWSALQRFVHAH